MPCTKSRSGLINSEELIQTLQQQYAAQAAFQLLTGDFQRTDRTSMARHSPHAWTINRPDLYRLDLVPWRRWANGFSCLFFVMVGAPFAIRLRNADMWTTFGLCFLPILLVYYPLLMYGLDRAKSGVCRPTAFGWVICACWGSASG